MWVADNGLLVMPREANNASTSCDIVWHEETSLKERGVGEAASCHVMPDTTVAHDCVTTAGKVGQLKRGG